MMMRGAYNLSHRYAHMYARPCTYSRPRMHALCMYASIPERGKDRNVNPNPCRSNIFSCPRSCLISSVRKHNGNNIHCVTNFGCKAQLCNPLCKAIQSLSNASGQYFAKISKKIYVNHGRLILFLKHYMHYSAEVKDSEQLRDK